MRKKKAADTETTEISPVVRPSSGKPIVKWNAVKHGLLTKEVIRSGRVQEEVEEYTTVLQRLRDDLQPQGIIEEMLIEKMAVSYWRFRRLLRWERQLHEQQQSTFLGRLIDAPAGQHDDALADFVPLLLRQPGAAAAKARDTLKLLRQFKQDIDTNGALSEDSREQISLLSKDMQQRLVASDGVLRNGIDAKLHERFKQDIATYLQEWISAFEKLVAVAEKMPGSLDSLTEFSTLPSREMLDAITRYGGAIEREFYRAMDQLERIQRRRGGEFVPAPASVTVTKTE